MRYNKFIFAVIVTFVMLSYTIPVYAQTEQRPPTNKFQDYYQYPMIDSSNFIYSRISSSKPNGLVKKTYTLRVDNVWETGLDGEITIIKLEDINNANNPEAIMFDKNVYPRVVINQKIDNSTLPFSVPQNYRIIAHPGYNLKVTFTKYVTKE